MCILELVSFFFVGRVGLRLRTRVRCSDCIARDKLLRVPLLLLLLIGVRFSVSAGEIFFFFFGLALDCFCFFFKTLLAFEMLFFL